MKEMRRPSPFLLVFPLMLATACPAAVAAPPPSPALPAMAPADPAASTLVDTFDNACLGYIGRPARLRVWLDAHYRMAEHDSEQYFLHDHPGKVWFRTTPTGRFVVILFGSGVCVVKAQHASVDDAYALLATRIAALGFTLQLTHDEKREIAKDVTMQFHTYTVHKDQANFLLEADGTPVSGQPIQMSLALQPQANQEKAK